MYITIKECDKLRTIVMDFEVAFRSYIASVLVNEYNNIDTFRNALIINKDNLPPSSSHVIRSKAGQFVSDPNIIYNLLENSNRSLVQGNSVDEKDVPDVASLIVLTMLFFGNFQAIISKFSDYSEYEMLSEKYRYVRNKLSHPGSEILEDTDMYLCLNFIQDISAYLDTSDNSFFWYKEKKIIDKDIFILQNLKKDIPVPIHNINVMPFADMHIVCRENEIKNIKEFIYGRPGALRKKSSYCIFGYGGLGKTALVLESIKYILKDVVEDSTINNYKPDFILFFSAKEERLDISYTSGSIKKYEMKKAFSNAIELQDLVFCYLGIESFAGFEKEGIIVVDNLESLSANDRKEVLNFIESMSPQKVQYIITSRNEEDFAERKEIFGFEEEMGNAFIQTYIAENDLDIILTNKDVKNLLELSKGNTLVLVMSLRRLSEKLATLEGIVSDLSKGATLSKLTAELGGLPVNGYEIISEFMFKNTFEEIEQMFREQTELIFLLLKVFAVYPEDNIDNYTLTYLTKTQYEKINPIITILSRYLILEKRGETYSLNRFAEKYIIDRFIADSETHLSILESIEKSIREIKKEQRQMDKDINNNTNLQRILHDWCINGVGDKIAAAKAYRIYFDVDQDIKKGNKFFVETGLENCIEEINALEKMTMHLYVKFQKARILLSVKRSKILRQEFTGEILKTYKDLIWVIKTNPLYTRMKSTQSYASVLWMYGINLLDNGDYQKSICYLEDSVYVFEDINIKEKDYFQCLSQLGRAYLDWYKSNKDINHSYLRKAKEVSDSLYYQKDQYVNYNKVKSYATQLRNEVYICLNEIK